MIANAIVTGERYANGVRTRYAELHLITEVPTTETDVTEADLKCRLLRLIYKPIITSIQADLLTLANKNNAEQVEKLNKKLVSLI